MLPILGAVLVLILLALTKVVMGIASVYELISGRVTAPSSTFTALTMNGTAPADSATVRNIDNAELLAAWSLVQGTTLQTGIGAFRIRGTGFHDTTQGLRLKATPYLAYPRFFGYGGKGQPLVKGDVLTLEATGSATAGDVETHHLLIYYGALKNGRFIDPNTVASRMKRITAVEVDFAATTSGDYASRAINADFDLFHADTEYAIIGYEQGGMLETAGAGVGFGSVSFSEASMTGGLRVGGPGGGRLGFMTREWFSDLSTRFGRPMIPVFKAGDKANVNCFNTNNENSLVAEVAILLAELSGKSD